MIRDWLRYLVVERRVKKRFFIHLFANIVGRMRQAALKRERRDNHKDHDFYGRYVGGFGIVAWKPQK
jgi:hypothetical protein